MEEKSKSLLAYLFIKYYVITMLFLLIILVIYVSSTHKNNSKQNIEDRALSLKYKDCYDWQEIEYIIFGESQE